MVARLTLCILALVAAPTPGYGAPLGFRDALTRARHDAYAARAQASEAQAKRADARRPLQGILPGVRLEAGYVRTTQPLNAFGFLLSQRQVTPEAFDPARLNTPDAISNWNAAVIAELPLVNLDAWAARAAASDAARGAEAATAWARDDAELSVVHAYYGAVLAREQITTLEQAVAAAHAHVDQAKALEESGVVTPADALLASVKAGELEVQLTEARHAAELALQGLAVALGADDDTAVEPKSHLPDASTVLALAESLSGDEAQAPRADVVASEANAEAASGDAKRTKAAMLPRLNAMGRLDWNSADMLFNGKTAWTVGVVASWSPFSGGAELAAAEAASSRARAARVIVDGTRARARLEARRSADAITVALERMRVSELAVAQSTEAHRIVGSKYDGGLTQVTEVLQSAAQETASRLAFADARYRIITAIAEHRHALGLAIERLADHLEPL